jgi:CheY-like chemotaxis protein
LAANKQIAGQGFRHATLQRPLLANQRIPFDCNRSLQKRNVKNQTFDPYADGLDGRPTADIRKAARHMITSSRISSKTILFIDDDKENREHWLNEVKRLSPHFAFLEADDGQSGLRLCTSQNVDCVVLDLDLPDMSGFEILLTLKADPKLRSIPVVVLTRLPSRVIHELAKDNGAYECLVKTHTNWLTLDQSIKRAMDSSVSS